MTGSPGSLAVLAGTFREVMAGVCTPVAVVTTMADSGPYGTTVSAFSSLANMEPVAPSGSSEWM